MNKEYVLYNLTHAVEALDKLIGDKLFPEKALEGAAWDAAVGEVKAKLPK